MCHRSFPLWQKSWKKAGPLRISGRSSWTVLSCSEEQTVWFPSPEKSLLSKKPLSSFAKRLKSDFFHSKYEGIKFNSGKRMEICCWCVCVCVCTHARASSGGKASFKVGNASNVASTFQVCWRCWDAGGSSGFVKEFILDLLVWSCVKGILYFAVWQAATQSTCGSTPQRQLLHPG